MKNHHVKIYRIDGAHSHKFIKLLELLGVKTIIFTDLDLKRNGNEKKVNIKNNDNSYIIPPNISDLEKKYKTKKKFLSTNTTIQYFIKEKLNKDNVKFNEINNWIFENLGDKDELSIDYNNITLYSQGKINGYYATSFEEAIILTNAVDKEKEGYKKSLIKLLRYVHPKMFKNINENDNIAEKSYMYQVKLSDGKSKFSTGIVYLSVTDKKFKLKLPKYIESGLNSLCKYFEEGMSNDIYN